MRAFVSCSSLAGCSAYMTYANESVAVWTGAGASAAPAPCGRRLCSSTACHPLWQRSAVSQWPATPPARAWICLCRGRPSKTRACGPPTRPPTGRLTPSASPTSSRQGWGPLRKQGDPACSASGGKDKRWGREESSSDGEGGVGGGGRVAVAAAIWRTMHTFWPTGRDQKGSSRKDDHMSAGQPLQRSRCQAQPSFDVLPATSFAEQAQYSALCPAFKASDTPPPVGSRARALRRVASRAGTGFARQTARVLHQTSPKISSCKLCQSPATDLVCSITPSTMLQVLYFYSGRSMIRAWRPELFSNDLAHFLNSCGR